MVLQHLRRGGGRGGEGRGGEGRAGRDGKRVIEFFSTSDAFEGTVLLRVCICVLRSSTHMHIIHNLLSKHKNAMILLHN